MASFLLLFDDGTYLPGETKRVLSERAWEMLDRLPSVLRSTPEFQAHCAAIASEVERIEAAAANLRDQFFPQRATALGLPWWEAVTRTTPDSDDGVQQRRDRMMALLGGGVLDGAEWRRRASLIMGPGWTYAEHDPGDSASPPPYTIRVTVPISPTGADFPRIERALRRITPANLDIIVQSASGFTLDSSQLDQEGFAS